MSLLLRGGTVVTAASQTTADLYIKDGVIHAVGKDLPFEADEEVDVTGQYVMPGGVDVHTHLDAPVGVTTTSDDFESGTKAAAVGGTTTIVDFAMQAPGRSLPDVIAEWRGKADQRSVVDYGLHIMVCDLYPGLESDLKDMVSEGITSFKVFMAFPGTFMIDDGQLLRVMKTGAQLGATVCIHAENGPVIQYLSEHLVEHGRTGPSSHPLARPPVTETEAVRRAISISTIAEAPIYFVHLSTEGAAEALHEAQASGLPVFGETCTHYLTLNDEQYNVEGFEPAKAVMAPPLRPQTDVSAMWRSIKSGTLGVVSSDHCPFCFSGQKDLGKSDFRSIPNGAPGIEDRMKLLYGKGVAESRIGFQDFVRVACTTPAKTFGMYPQKGEIAPGSDADVMVIDPKLRTLITSESQLQNVDYNLWEGTELPGRITHVYSRGELIAKDGKYVGKEGRGHFLKRSVAN